MRMPLHRLLSPVWMGCLVLGALCTLSGCTSRVVSHHSPDYAHHRPTHIAVMPIHNATGKPLTAPPARAYIKTLLERAFFSHDHTANNVDVAWRRHIQYALRQKGYQVLPLQVVDTNVEGTSSKERLASPEAPATKLSGVDGLLYSTITAWDTRKLKTDNAITVAASFELVDATSQRVLWAAEWPYGNVSIKATQPWHDIRYYIARLVDDAFVTLP